MGRHVTFLSNCTHRYLHQGKSLTVKQSSESVVLLCFWIIKNRDDRLFLRIKKQNKKKNVNVPEQENLQLLNTTCTWGAIIYYSQWLTQQLLRVCVCVCVVVLSALSVLRVCKSVRLKAHAVVTHSFRLYWWVSSVFVLTETLTLHIVVRATMAGGDYTLDN